MLCHGNVNRSPLAAAVLARELGVENVRSGACKNYEGVFGPKPRTLPPATKKVREFAERLGLDLTGHRAQTVRQEDMDWADLILYMDPANRDRMEEFTTTANWSKARCLASYIGKKKLPDPAFVSRGPVLEQLLAWVVEAAEACAREVRGNENPRR